MAVLRLAWLSLLNRRWTVLLTVLTIALSVAVLLGVERIRTNVRDSFASTVSGTDLIVGARSGPINLLLYSVFHVGDATNNVSWQSYQELSALPQVAWAVPISLGDSHRGFRVMGTTTAFFTRYHYGARHPLAFAQGKPFNDLYDAVVGADVARALHYELGREIVVAHGIGGFLKHKDKPFRVVGVLRRTGTPVDGTVIVSLEAIEAIHVDWRSGAYDASNPVTAAQARKFDLTPKTITAFMLGLKTRMATFSVQRAINDYPDEPLLAILPGVALQQLWSLVGVAENALRLVSALVVLAGLTGMLTALLASLNERRREMAILRAVGARVRVVFGLLLMEAMVLTVTGCALGIAAAYLGVWAARDAMAERLGILLPLAPPSVGEWQLLAIVLLGGALVGCVPAAIAYRRTLIDGLTPRT